MVKKAKITRVHRVNEFNRNGSTTFYHMLELDNGDKIEIGKKKRLEVGYEIIYEADDDNFEYHKAKPKYPSDLPSEGTTYYGGGDDLKGIKIGHALTNAVSLVCAHGHVEGMGLKDSIRTYADLILQISEEMNQGAPTPAATVSRPASRPAPTPPVTVEDDLPF